MKRYDSDLTLLHELSLLFGPSGCEGEVADVIERALPALCDSFARDRMGNLIALIRTGDPSSENRRRVKAATSSIYVLRHTSVPAILIECGFLSTPDECERLSDATYRQGLALVFFAAIHENLGGDACTRPSDML